LFLLAANFYFYNFNNFNNLNQGYALPAVFYHANRGKQNAVYPAADVSSISMSKAEEGANSQNHTPEVCVRSACYRVEAAVTPQEQALGLMSRQSLDNGQGMLFLFEQDEVYVFWMKDTLIPLDIVWIDSNDKIVFISKNNLPCKNDACPSINPKQTARYVLEVNAGEMDRIGAQIGDQAAVNLFAE
jgi:uncharacterized membrane protein (UPF0127 family)